MSNVFHFWAISSSPRPTRIRAPLEHNSDNAIAQMGDVFIIMRKGTHPPF